MFKFFWLDKASRVGGTRYQLRGGSIFERGRRFEPAPLTMRQMLGGRVERKLLLQLVGNLLECLGGILGHDQLLEDRQQTLYLHATTQAPYGIRRLLVLDLGQLVGMQQEAMINQQAQNQAAA